MAEKCEDCIIGLDSGYGMGDIEPDYEPMRLIRESERGHVILDEDFNFCPVCGRALKR
jgi:hypothetical protein